MNTRGVKKHILIVDDDEDLRVELAEQLEELYKEFQISQAGNGRDTLRLVNQNSYDLILLDIGLPDMDGRDLCRLIRREGVRSPIIMLTAVNTDADTILSLDSGANDFVTKPFQMNVLLARLRAQLRQFEQMEDTIFNIGPYKFRSSSKVLVDERDGKKVRLTDKEAAILRYLHRAGDKVVSREELLTGVWGYGPNLTTHTLETHVYRLRQKIESNPSRAEFLITEAGGYRLSV